MGVVLLGAPGVDTEQLIGEALPIDNTRRLWTEFYNVAGGGRGKVCTELLRPCRGRAFAFGTPRVVEDGRCRATDGLAAPGELVAVEIASPTSATSRAGQGELRRATRWCSARAEGDRDDRPGRRPATVKLPGRITRNRELRAAAGARHPGAGRKGPSRALSPGGAGPEARTGRGLRGPGCRRAGGSTPTAPTPAHAGPLGGWDPAAIACSSATRCSRGRPISGTRAFATGVERRRDRQRRGAHHAGVAAASRWTGLGEPACRTRSTSWRRIRALRKEVLVPGAGGLAAGAGVARRQTWTRGGPGHRSGHRLAAAAGSAGGQAGRGAGAADDGAFPLRGRGGRRQLPAVVEAVIDDVGVFRRRRPARAPARASGPTPCVAPAVEGGGCSVGGGGPAARPWSCCWRRWLLPLRRRRRRRGPAAMTSDPAGVLYVVSSPLGNPDDLSPRARRTLARGGPGVRRGHPHRPAAAARPGPRAPAALLLRRQRGRARRRRRWRCSLRAAGWRC